MKMVFDEFGLCKIKNIEYDINGKISKVVIIPKDFDDVEVDLTYDDLSEQEKHRLERKLYDSSQILFS